MKQRVAKAEEFTRPMNSESGKRNKIQNTLYNKYALPSYHFSESSNNEGTKRKYPVTDEEILNSEIGEVTEAEEQARYLIGLGKELPKDIEDELLRTLEVRKKRNKIWESHRNTRKLSEDIIWSVLKKFGFKG
jgi:hypothetical protein